MDVPPFNPNLTAIITMGLSLLKSVVSCFIPQRRFPDIDRLVFAFYWHGLKIYWPTKQKKTFFFCASFFSKRKA
jgi:hypothetical protein